MPQMNIVRRSFFYFILFYLCDESIQGGQGEATYRLN